MSGAFRGTSTLAAGLLLSGCAAVERGGEDALVVASYPIHAVTTPVDRMRVRYGEDPRAAVVLSPIYVPIYLIEDTLFTGVHAVDAGLSPFFLPFGVKPLGAYDLSSGVPRLRTEDIRKAEEDALVVFAHAAYVFAMFGCAFEGYWYPSRASSAEDRHCEFQ